MVSFLQVNRYILTMMNESTKGINYYLKDFRIYVILALLVLLVILIQKLPG
jgi:hypothetical protein